MMVVAAPVFWTPLLRRHALFGIVLLGAGAYGEHEWRRNARMHERASNERNAATTLKMLSSAEAEFRANDRDVNGVNDYWTADVAGLYYIQARGKPIALIPKEIADADASPIRPTDKDPVPVYGYFFAALLWDESTSPRTPYRLETDGKTGKVHNLHRFGFVAFPAEPGVSGKYIYIINEKNSNRRTYGWEGPPPESWPSDEQIKNRWSTVCRISPEDAEARLFLARIPKAALR